MPRELLIEGGHVVTVDPDLGDLPADVEAVIVGGDVVKRDGVLAGDHVEQARKLIHATRHHLGA
jgi:5-methylthioadenosine/S-adenosylhomocysteine deaminase